MDFRSLSRGARIRIAVFVVMAGFLVYQGAACVAGFRRLQLDQIAQNAANSEVYIDGADFSLFFLAGSGLLNTLLTAANAIAYTLVMLALGAVFALLLRAVGLRKSWAVDPAEHKLCATVYAAMIALGAIVSLILTKGGLLLAVVMFELPSAAMMWLIYLRELKRRTKTAKQGHFIEGVEQDLTEL